MEGRVHPCPFPPAPFLLFLGPLAGGPGDSHPCSPRLSWRNGGLAGLLIAAGCAGRGRPCYGGGGECPLGLPLPHTTSPRLGLALRAAAFVSRGAGRLGWALPRPLCPARALQMGKPDAAELGEGIDLGGSLCGGATLNPPGVVPGPGYCVEARSSAAWVFLRTPAGGRRGPGGCTPGALPALSCTPRGPALGPASVQLPPKASTLE